MRGHVRLAEPRDGAALAAIYAPSVFGSAASFELVAPDALEMARRVSANLAFAPWLVLEQSADILGYAYAARHREREAYQWSARVPGALRCGASEGLSRIDDVANRARAWARARRHSPAGTGAGR